MLRHARTAAVCTALAVALGALVLGACNGRKVPAASIGGDELEGDLSRLGRAPFPELSFVPADAELVLRVDLAALARTDPGAPQMLDFLLHAQQPAAHKMLTSAGMRPGRELRAIYLVVGPRAAESPAVLVAGVGQVDPQRAREAFGGGGATAEQAPGGATVFVWPHEHVERGMGSALPAGALDGPRGLAKFEPKDPEDQQMALLEESAVAVADGLVLFGPPALVRRALAVRAGEGKDVRTGVLARELVALEGDTLAWGVARRDGAGLVRGLVPGLERGRFHLDLAAVGKGGLQLRAVFESDAAASAFAQQLDTMIGAMSIMAKKSPIGERLAALREGTPVRVAGKVVTIDAVL